MSKLLIFIGIVLMSFSLIGQQQNKWCNHFYKNLMPKRSVEIQKRSSEKHSKSVAAGLNITLGLFGVHRLYLGTAPQIPVIYTLTLGGGGFLMLSDLGVILFTKDLEQFSNNSQVIMWSKNEE